MELKEAPISLQD
jgi:hypothetical protein